MTKLISISVWGTDPRYLGGALANARRYRTIYPGWEMRVYTDAESGFTKALREHGCEIRIGTNLGGFYGTFWRFLPISEPGIEAVIFRDADSLLNVRESAAVAEWLQSGATAHVMRDHPMHLQWPILAGMWGIRGGAIPDIERKIACWGQWHKRLDDQRFLKDVVWPLIARDCVQHTRGYSPWGGQPFPPHPPAECNYVGEVYDPVNKSAEPMPAEVRRNSPCPCGSGRKYKGCCGAFFWDASGKPVSPGQYVDALFRKLS